MSKVGRSLLLALVLIIPTGVVAQQARYSVKMNKVGGWVRRAEARGKLANSKVRQLESLIQSSEQELKRVVSRMREYQVKGNELLKKRDRFNQELTTLEGRMKYYTNLFLRRIKALYMYQEDGLFVRALQVSDSGSAVRDAYFLGKIWDYDQKVIRQIRSTEWQIKAKKNQQKGLLSEYTNMLEVLRSQRNRIDQQIMKHKLALGELDSSKKQVAKVKKRLKAKAKEVDTAVKSVVKEAVKSPPSPPPSWNLFKKSKQPKLEGLKVYEKNVVLPVAGSVVRGFKSQTDGMSFAEIVTSKGWVFDSPLGSKVKSVAHGRVLFSGNMPGYSEVLIIDHGERFYSLYSRLGKVRVKLGQFVEQGETLAWLPDGRDDSYVGTFYFELRKNGEAVNPQPFYPSIIPASASN